jgi:hypothetical protein
MLSTRDLPQCIATFAECISSAACQLEDGMRQQEYWVNRKKQLNQDLVGLRESLTELAPSVQEWDKFNVRATKELRSGHESFRSSVRWAMVRKLTFRHGTKMWDVSARFAQRLESSSKFRLLAHVGETADGQCRVMTLPRLDSSTSASECFPLKASARRTITRISRTSIGSRSVSAFATRTALRGCRSSPIAPRTGPRRC